MEGWRRSNGVHSPGLIIACVHSWVLAVIHGCWPSFMHVGFHSWAPLVHSWMVGMSLGHLWALNVHGWGVTVINGGGVICGRSKFVGGCCLWALDICGWGVVVVHGGSHVVSCLWAVEDVCVGVIFIHL